MANNPFRGHDFYFLGDDGELYRIKNRELIKSKWTPTPEEEPAYKYFKNLAENDGVILSLRTESTTDPTVSTAFKADGESVAICLLLNFRSLRT